MADLMVASAKLRQAVLELDEGLSLLIGTDEYPGGLTALHVQIRLAGLAYDRAMRIERRGSHA